MYRKFSTLSKAFQSATQDTFYKQLETKWWDLNGVLGPLHSLNSLRIPLIRDGLLNSFHKIPDRPSEPLRGFKILDIGCGGGILSEPLARLGASVTAVDPVPSSIEAAQAHAKLDDSVLDKINYICSRVEDLPPECTFDAVVASEVIEHGLDPDRFVETAVNFTKVNGSLFFTTFNRTWLSYVLGIVVAENIMGLVPKGTHDWNKFVQPKELLFQLESKGCDIRLVTGMCYNPFTQRCSWQKDTSVNYAVHAIRRS